MDLDVTLKAVPLTKENLEYILNEIISISTYDKLVMAIVGIDEIHEDADYPGYRASISVFFDGIKELIKVDFTTGDALTPHEVPFNYHTLLSGKRIELKSYNLETLLAEKVETILTRGILNTRMRDYYDVHILMTIKQASFNDQLFVQAFCNTSKYRHSFDKIRPIILAILSSIQADDGLKKRWSSYQKSNPYALEIRFDEVMSSLKNLIISINSFD
jgi:hypothetical protein